MQTTNTVWAEHALTGKGWQSAVAVSIDTEGRIVDVSPDTKACGTRVGILLPAVANLHSHAFQRAMSGMTETRGPDPSDSFWSWRKLMYRFLMHLNPDDAESIAAFGQMEMLESGYAAVGEFHYLHHQPDGKPYAQIAEMSERILAASFKTGIGLTLLPVLYEQGGCDGRELTGGQLRFGNSFDQFEKLYAEVASCIEKHHQSAGLGIAPHSIRAVSKSSLVKAHELVNNRPFHIHVAEQEAEVQEVLHMWNARPVQWLFDQFPVSENWCLIHATQMLPDETIQLASSGAIAGLCPITESNLGDGIFDGKRFLENNGLWGIGTDSNVRISLSEEIRTLEYSQRLRDKGRAILAEQARSSGRVLFDAALQGGAKALQRECGRIEQGYLADMLALDLSSSGFLAVENDQWLDAWIFAQDDQLITDVWSSGQHLVESGRHVHRDQIEDSYRKTMSSLRLSL